MLGVKFASLSIGPDHQLPARIDDLTIGTVGIRDLATSTGRTPLVTMVILAYNQQAYIEQAIAGALAQDYSNLEIVISDDGSSDATFEIIKQAARDYRGPHRIVTNRTPANHGILAHFYAAVTASSGALIIAAAGDDISIPARVSTLVAQWQSTGALALSSDWFVIDDQGIERGTGSRAAEISAETKWFADRHFTMIGGATAAYDRRVFDAIALPDFAVLAEDYFFALILRLRSQKVVRVAEPLVYYRVHGKSVINRPLASSDLLPEERRLEAYTSMIGQIYDHVLSLAKSGAGVDPSFGTPAVLRWPAIRAQTRDIAFRASWIDASPWQRLVAALRPPFAMAKLRWAVPRLGGLATLRLQRRLTAAYRRRR